MLHKLVRGGHGDGADLVQRHHDHPELPVPLQYYHDPLAALYAEHGEVVGRFGGHTGNVLKGEFALREIVADPKHGALVRAFRGKRIHHVVCKVEVFRAVQSDAGEFSVFVNLLVGEVAVYFALEYIGGDSRPHGVLDRLVDRVLLAGFENDRKENTVLAAHGYHSVRV